MDPEPDTRIGSLVDDRYSILEAMAAGSMGAVYKAERVPVGKLVAIKFLHNAHANDAEFLARFERETRVMSKLAHPNCVSVVDFGVWQDSPYLVMEFVAGTTLRAVIDDVVIAPARALALARQIAIGLAHAHSHGIVHRDIKPANIMITEQLGTGESVRILDFGLARLRDGSGGRDPTLHNVVVGTPNYMAPEQTVAGGKVDERTDIYAAGVVLYEMIVGDKPFAAEDTLSLLAMHRSAPIPRLVNHVDGELPEGLQELLDRAMAKAPGDRYQTAMELADAIEAVAAAPYVDTAKRRSTTPALGIAPTLLDAAHAATQAPVPQRGWTKPLLGAVILLGGVAAIAGYLIHRAAADDSKRDAGTVAIGSLPAEAAVAVPDAPSPEGDGAIPAVAADAEELTGDSADVVAAISSDAGAPNDVVADADVAVAPGDAETVAVTGDAGSDEIEMDPMTASDPDPAAPVATKHVEEAPDAPKTDVEIEKRAPVAPVLAQTVGGAIQQIKDGNRPLALASLRALWRKQPGSAYIPFLLGNLYFDERWWSVAMDHYRKAIMKNPAYKSNPVINQNVIQMLASPKTQSFAVYFLRTTIGHPAAIYVKYAAAHAENPIVKKQAAALAKLIH